MVYFELDVTPDDILVTTCTLEINSCKKILKVKSISALLSSMGLFLYREILCYPTPINFNYWYGIGLLLVFLLVNQVLTGIQVGSYYIVSIDVALSSVDYNDR